jgi:hypothetical protein
VKVLITQIPLPPPFSKGDKKNGEECPPLKKEGWGDFLTNTFRILFLVSFLSYLPACGSKNDSSSDTTTDQPVLLSVQPNAGKAQDTITLQGIGFSVTFNENIVLVGNASTPALSHQFISPTPNGATEEITAQIPSNAQVGPGLVSVIVSETPSNGLPFTVESP